MPTTPTTCREYVDTALGLLSSRRTWLVALLLAAMLPSQAYAQGPQDRTRIVLRGGWATELEAGAAGLAVRIPLGEVIELLPSADYIFVDVGDAWQGNIDASIRIGKRKLFYVGTGFAILNFKVGNAWNSDLGLNLFAGLAVETPGGRFGLLVEPRFTVRDGSDPFYVSLGVSYAFGS